MHTADHSGHSQRADCLEEELGVEVTVNQTRQGEFLSSRHESEYRFAVGGVCLEDDVLVLKSTNTIFFRSHNAKFSAKRKYVRVHLIAVDLG